MEKEENSSSLYLVAYNSSIWQWQQCSSNTFAHQADIIIYNKSLHGFFTVYELQLVIVDDSAKLKMSTLVCRCV